METKQITEDMRNKLRKPLDAKAVTKHPTKTYLSSIKAIYVTERLNDVFGVGAWQTKTEEIERGNKGMVVVKVALEIPQYGVYYESYGGNNNGGEGSKNFDLGDAYKGATTDAITKIGSYLEIGIDVFKGLSSASHNKTEEPQKPWLNLGSKEWNGALSKNTELTVLRDYFRISKANAEQYEIALKKQK